MALDADDGAGGAVRVGRAVRPAGGAVRAPRLRRARPGAAPRRAAARAPRRARRRLHLRGEYWLQELIFS